MKHNIEKIHKTHHLYVLDKTIEMCKNTSLNIGEICSIILSLDEFMNNLYNSNNNTKEFIESIALISSDLKGIQQNLEIKIQKLVKEKVIAEEYYNVKFRKRGGDRVNPEIIGLFGSVKKKFDDVANNSRINKEVTHNILCLPEEILSGKIKKNNRYGKESILKYKKEKQLYDASILFSKAFLSGTFKIIYRATCMSLFPYLYSSMIGRSAMSDIERNVMKKFDEIINYKENQHFPILEIAYHLKESTKECLTKEEISEFLLERLNSDSSKTKLFELDENFISNINNVNELGFKYTYKIRKEKRVDENSRKSKIEKNKRIFEKFTGNVDTISYINARKRYVYRMYYNKSNGRVIKYFVNSIIFRFFSFVVRAILREKDRILYEHVIKGLNFVTINFTKGFSEGIIKHIFSSVINKHGSLGDFSSLSLNLKIKEEFKKIVLFIPNLCQKKLLGDVYNYLDLNNYYDSNSFNQKGISTINFVEKVKIKFFKKNKKNYGNKYLRY